MSFAGDYKIPKMMAMKEDESGFGFRPIREVLKDNDDPGEARENAMMINSVFTIPESEDVMIQHMPIPEDVSEEEIEKAKKSGHFKLYGEDMQLGEQVIKSENGVLYLYDRQKMLNGEEWVKISTDEEGVLNMIMYIYEKQ